MHEQSIRHRFPSAEPEMRKRLMFVMWRTLTKMDYKIWYVILKLRALDLGLAIAKVS